MKKLKLQKALLAICLALPLTLTTNHAISAMDTNIEISANKDDNKETNAQQIQQEQLELIANKPTHTAALQYYVDITQPKKFGEEEYKQFLTYYIKNNIGKYLALIIQAKNNLIQFPNNTNLDTTLTSEAINRMLINNDPKNINPIYSKSNLELQELITKIQQYFSALDKVPTDGLPAVEKIFKELFIPAATPTRSYLMKKITALTSIFWRGNEDSTNNLTKLIDTYIKQQEQGQTEEETLIKFILIYSEDIVKQLHKDAAAFDEKHVEEQRKLNDIADQIQRVFDAYKDKQTEKEEEKKESELNESNLSSKSQKIDDILIEDYKEENITTNKNEELEINKGAEQEKEKDEPAAQKKDPIINQSISSIKEDESESNQEEEKIDKRKESTVALSLSQTSEVKKVDNDKENKEDEKSKNDKQIDPEIKAVQDETQKEVKGTQTENKKSDDTDIEEIKQLINEWQQKKDDINKNKEGKLTQLEKDIESLEQKYKNIVKVDEKDDDDNMC